MCKVTFWKKELSVRKDAVEELSTIYIVNSECQGPINWKSKKSSKKQFFVFFSSGLDIVTSKQCITLLKELASLNRTVICTIHQPSASILDLFHHLYVVANGSCMYQGSVSALLPYLSEVHLTCPTFHNPSDFCKWSVLSENVYHYFIVCPFFSIRGN